MATKELTPTELDMIRALQHRGYAVAVFTPSEMPQSNPLNIEMHMIVAGWDRIDADNRQAQKAVLQ